MPRRHFNQIIEIEETLFGNHRVTDRWENEAGEHKVDVYEVTTDEELMTLLDDIGASIKSRKRLHLL